MRQQQYYAVYATGNDYHRYVHNKLLAAMSTTAPNAAQRMLDCQQYYEYQRGFSVVITLKNEGAAS